MAIDPLDICAELFAKNIGVKNNFVYPIIKSGLYKSEKVREFYLKNQEEFDELAIFFETKNIDYSDYIDFIIKKANKEIWQPLFLIIKENYEYYLEHIEITKFASFQCGFFKSLKYFIEKCKEKKYVSFQDYISSEIIVSRALPGCFADLMQGKISMYFFVMLPGIAHYLKCWSKDIIKELGLDGFDFEHLNRIGLAIVNAKYNSYENYIKCISEELAKVK
jgi:hypothetical protein